MGAKQNKVGKFGILAELVECFWESPWWWLTPMLVVLVFVGALIMFAQSSSVAPFIYALF